MSNLGQSRDCNSAGSITKIRKESAPAPPNLTLKKEVKTAVQDLEKKDSVEIKDKEQQKKSENKPEDVQTKTNTNDNGSQTGAQREGSKLNLQLLQHDMRNIKYQNFPLKILKLALKMI